MRYVNIALGMLMLVFAALQYNDPDPHIWMPVYGIPAMWAMGAGFWLPRVASAGGVALLVLCVLAYAALVLYYWPQAPEFWRQEVWWDDEEAREGMGAMTAFAVLLVVSAAVLRAKTRRS